MQKISKHIKIFCLTLCLLALSIAVGARPQVVVVVVDHLTLTDITHTPLAGFTEMLQEGQVALMSPGIAHGKHPTSNVYASLGAGDSIRVGSVSQGRLETAVQEAGLRTALIDNDSGDDTGPYDPARLLLPFPNTVYDPTVLSPTSPGGRVTAPIDFQREISEGLKHSALVIADFGDFARLEREKQQGDLTPAAYALHRQNALERLSDCLGLALVHPQPAVAFFVVVPTAPLLPNGTWDQLTPFVWIAPGGMASGDGALQTDTTQTPGLVAARDLAPTVLHWLQIPVPVQMTGSVIGLSQRYGEDDGLARLGHIDQLTRLNQEAQGPLFWGLGLLAPLLVFSFLALYYLGKLTAGSPCCRMASYAVSLLSAWPLALLLVPLMQPRTLDIYLTQIVILSAFIALLPSPTVIFSVTALVLLFDGMTGTALVSQSVLSAYILSGIRFYGIGNEYMGVLMGGALLAASAFAAIDKPPRLIYGTIALWFVLVVVVLSFPSFGAKAGGAITATPLFWLAWLRLQGVRLRVRQAAAGVTAGFVLVFVWAWLSEFFHLRRTHMETAVHALQGGRIGYIWGIIRQKLGLAFHVFLHPGTLLGVLALAIVAVAARSVFRQTLGQFYARRPRLAAVSEAGLWGCVICVLFNDSGIVAAILLLMCLILPALHGLFQESCDLLPSMSEMSESASPSVTPSN